MSAEHDLGVLLRTMRAYAVPGEFAFCTSPELPPGLDVATDLAGGDLVAVVREAEGPTLVLARERADELGLAYDYVAAMISLEVRSALAAVGLTAAVATALAGAGLSCNVIAGFHHDHLFVPADRAPEALAVLHRLSAESSG